MPAYSFRARFVAPILTGDKTQTIRATGKRRHAQPSETVQLYTAMRTKHCRLIGRAVCNTVQPITIDTRDHWIDFPATGVRYTKPRDLDFFARIDGFPDWPDMLAFWRAEHKGVDVFTGLLIRWTDFQPASGWSA